MTEKEKLTDAIRMILQEDKRILFAYLYGSFVGNDVYRDIDIGIYIASSEELPYTICSDLKTRISRFAKSVDVMVSADQIDVRVINDAPFTFLKRIFKEGILLKDTDPDLRTDLIERVSVKYRECAGLLAEALLR